MNVLINDEVRVPVQHFTPKRLKLYLLCFQFHDGVYLIFLLGLLEGFFVPLYQFYITPATKDQKVQS